MNGQYVIDTHNNIFLLVKVLYVGLGYWLEGLRNYHLKKGYLHCLTLPTTYQPTYLPTIPCYVMLHYTILHYFKLHTHTVHCITIHYIALIPLRSVPFSSVMCVCMPVYVCVVCCGSLWCSLQCSVVWCGKVTFVQTTLINIC